MAILAKIRQRTLVLILIIGLALFAFVISDVWLKGDTGQKQPDEIGSVNGETIPLQNFQNQVEYGLNISRGSRSTVQVVNTVWDQQLRSTLISQQLEELGITIEKDEIWSLLVSNPNITQNPQFQDESGVFVEAKLKAYIDNLEAARATDPAKEAEYQNWLATEDFIVRQAKENLYYNLVRAGSIATVSEAEMAYRMENDKVTFKFVQIPYASINNDDVEVRKSDIKNYMDKHTSKFEVEASRDIQYVYFEERASKKDEDDAKAEVQDFKKGLEDADDAIAYATENTQVNENTDFMYKNQLPKTDANAILALNEGDVYGPYRVGNQFKISRLVETKQMPDSVKSRHILIRFAGSAGASADVTKTKEEAKKQADSIYDIVKRNKSKFADIAKEISDDGSKDKGGDLGWYTNLTGLTPNFKEYIFQNDEGDMGVVESPFGYHVIEIQEQKNKQKAVKLASISKEIESSEETLSDLFTSASKFQAEAAKGNEEFVDLANANSYDVKTAKNLRELDAQVIGIGNQRQIVKWAFNKETEVGDIDRFNVGNGFVVVQVTAAKPEGMMSVEDASATVLQKIRNQKKAEMIKSNNSASTLAELASANNTSVEMATAVTMQSSMLPGAGAEQKVVGAAFAMEEGATSKLITGENGVYMIEVVKKTPAVAKDTYLTEMNTLRNQQASSATNSVYNALKSAAEIEDNRAIFY